ncbi:hypothetical protein [Aliivibrio fischeri]|uniref:hypothetical protein n=1 Tax=Aliivibrio fischeri TaxID=668 RepID=UPI0007C45E39|nr:hypothetical protein [Aliivibrio fischeri]
MDWMIINQLKAEVSSELKEFIPQGYFEQDLETFKFNKYLDPDGFLTKQKQWGYLAASLGNELLQSNKEIMTAKQKCASQVLLFIGLYESTYAGKKITEKNHLLACEKNLIGNNVPIVLEEHKLHLKEYEKSLKKSLNQYLLYVDSDKSKAFYPIFTERDLIDFGLKQSLKNKILLSIQKNLTTIVVSVITSVCSVYALTILGIKS